MRKNVKIVLGLVLVFGFIAISSNQLLSPASSEAPLDDRPDDPGNSTGPGLGSIPTEDIVFKIISEDVDIVHVNLQL